MNHDESAGRVCRRCGISLEGRSPKAIYCSDRCRNGAGHHRRYHANLDASRAAGRAKARRLAAAKTARAATPPPGRWSRFWAKLIAVARFVGTMPL